VRTGPAVVASGAVLLTIPLLLATLLLLPFAGSAAAQATMAKPLAMLAVGVGVEPLRQLAAHFRLGLDLGFRS
jgi:hypothetical protein